MIKPPFSSIKSPTSIDRIAQLDLVRPSTFIRVLLFETLPCDGSNSHGPQCFFPNHHQFFVFHGSNSSSPQKNTPRWYTSQEPKGRTSVTFPNERCCGKKNLGSSAPSSQRLLYQCPTGQHRRGGVRLRKALHLLLREPALPRQLGQTAGILRLGVTCQRHGCIMHRRIPSSSKNDSCRVKTYMEVP